MISSRSKIFSITLILAALATVGQSCSISLGTPKNVDGGVYRSDNHGQNWAQKTFVRQDKKTRITLSDATANFLTLDPQDANRVYLGVRHRGLWVSTNRGDRWAATGLSTGDDRCLTFDPLNDQILYLATSNQIRKSVDQAKTWKTVYTEPQPGQTIECTIVDPLRGNIIWLITTGGKIVRSADYGATWTLVNTDAKLRGIVRLDIDPASGGAVSVFTNRRGIYRIDPSGVTVTNASAGLKLYRNAISIRDVDIVRTATGSSWYLATGYGVLVSQDNGGSWQAIPTLLNPSTNLISNIAINPKASSEIFLTTGRKLHHSVDTGGSWSITNLPSTRQPVWLTFDPTNVDRLYVGTFIEEKKK